MKTDFNRQHRLSRWLLAALCAALLPASLAAQSLAAADPVAVAEALLDDMDAGRYGQAHDRFDKRMAAAVSREQLQELWEALPKQIGARTGRDPARADAQSPASMARALLHHEHASLEALVAIDGQARVTGFRIVPAAAPAPATAPAAAPEGVIEHELAVGEGDSSLPATLSLPASAKGPVPGVVLVHGSGPHDRDQTLGGSAIFRDLAHGLAQRGIAVLRYVKRSKAYPEQVAATPTLDVEVVDDAVAAVALLAAREEVDGSRMFVLGHSQGAALAPRIAKRSRAAGAVLMAAPARPLQELVLEQTRHIVALDGEVDAAERKALDELAAQAARVDALARGEAVDGPLPLGLPERYWRDLLALDPVAEAQALDKPILVLAGGRDYQVPEADTQRFEQGLATRDDVELHRFPELNHLFIAGEGISTPEEYFREGRMAEEAIDVVAAFVLGGGR